MSSSPDQAGHKAAGRIWPGSWVVAGALCVVVGCCVFGLYLTYKHAAEEKAAQEKAKAEHEQADIEKYGAEDDAIRVMKEYFSQISVPDMNPTPKGKERVVYGPSPIMATLDRATGRWTVTGIFHSLSAGDDMESDMSATLFYTPTDKSWHFVGAHPLPHFDRRVSMVEGVKRFKVEGGLEGESLKVLGKSSDFPLERQDAKPLRLDGLWSDDSQLWGRPPKAGEWADLELSVPIDGEYTAIVYLTKGPDYGVVQFSLDGKPLGQPFDGFEPDKVAASGPVQLGTVELKKGTATLRVEATGTSNKSVGVRYAWGLDCVRLRPSNETEGAIWRQSVGLP